MNTTTKQHTQPAATTTTKTKTKTKTKTTIRPPILPTNMKTEVELPTKTTWGIHYKIFLTSAIFVLFRVVVLSSDTFFRITEEEPLSTRAFILKEREEHSNKNSKSDTCQKCSAYHKHCDFQPESKTFIYGSTCDTKSILTNNKSTSKISCAIFGLQKPLTNKLFDAEKLTELCLGSSLCIAPTGTSDLKSTIVSGWWSSEPYYTRSWTTILSGWWWVSSYYTPSWIFDKPEERGYRDAVSPQIFGKPENEGHLYSHTSAPTPSSLIFVPIASQTIKQNETMTDIASILLPLLLYSIANGDGLGNTTIILPCLVASPHWINITKIASGSPNIRILDCNDESLLCVQGDARILTVNQIPDDQYADIEGNTILKNEIIKRGKRLKLEKYATDLLSILWQDVSKESVVKPSTLLPEGKIISINLLPNAGKQVILENVCWDPSKQSFGLLGWSNTNDIKVGRAPVTMGEDRTSWGSTYSGKWSNIHGISVDDSSNILAVSKWIDDTVIMTRGFGYRHIGHSIERHGPLLPLSFLLPRVVLSSTGRLKINKKGVAVSNKMIALFVGVNENTLDFLGESDWETKLKALSPLYTKNNNAFADAWDLQNGDEDFQIGNISDQKVCFKRMIHVGVIKYRRQWLMDPGLAHLYRARYRESLKGLKTTRRSPFPWAGEKESGNLVCVIIIRNKDKSAPGVRDIDNPKEVGNYISNQVKLLGFKVSTCHQFILEEWSSDFQAEAVHSMDIIISVDGSQLVNLIFARRTTIVILFHVPQWYAYFEDGTIAGNLESELGLSFLHFRSMNKSLSGASQFGLNISRFDAMGNSIRDSLIRVSIQEMENSTHLWRDSLLDALYKQSREKELGEFF